jgi:AraC-like DNA-binding protein
VGKWRQRFVERRLAGLYDELRPGRPRSIEDEQIAALLKRTLSRKPTAGTHWSIRQAAQASGISRSTVHRLFQTFALQPHRSRSFKLSTDPFFVEKVRDIVGLYLNPPDHALVLCVDEKSLYLATAPAGATFSQRSLRKSLQCYTARKTVEWSFCGPQVRTRDIGSESAEAQFQLRVRDHGSTQRICPLRGIGLMGLTGSIFCVTSKSVHDGLLLSGRLARRPYYLGSHS